MAGLMIAMLAVLAATGDERAEGDILQETVHVNVFNIHSSSGREFKVAVNMATGRGTTIEISDNAEDPQVRSFSTEIHFIGQEDEH